MPGQCAETLIFPYAFSMIIEPVLWLYYTNFPMAFHPVDISRKFGFNYPVGMFMDDIGSRIIKNSISGKDYEHFEKYAKFCDLYDDLMSFYNSRADLTDNEIEATWDKENDGKYEGLLVSHCKVRTKLRVINELFSLIPQEEKFEHFDVISENMGFDRWKKFYKKIK